MNGFCHGNHPFVGNPVLNAASGKTVFFKLGTVPWYSLWAVFSAAFYHSGIWKSIESSAVAWKPFHIVAFFQEKSPCGRVEIKAVGGLGRRTA